MNDWTAYAVFGFLLFIALVVAPVVAIIDRKRRRTERHERKPGDGA